MDNCDLEKITISVGTLDPPFQPSITRYKVTVPSNINQVTLNLQTSDCGASYRICFGNGSNVLNVDDGMNQVDIEVVAEDGTSQIYCIEVIKLSASTAKLEDLIVSPDTKLHPTFSANMYEYSCMVNFDCDAVTILPKIPDDNMQVSVNGTHIPGQIRLAVGDTRIETKVCSADGTKSQVYTVLVTRKEIPLAFTFNDVKDRLEYECPVSLTAFYRPVSVSPSEPKHIFSSPYIDMLTRRSKVNPLNELPLKESWRVPELDLDRRMSAALVQCPFHYRGCESLLRLSEAGSHAKGCPCRPPQKLDPKEVTGTEWYKKYFAFSNKLEIETKHTLEMRSWEMRLQTAIGGDDVGELSRHGDAQLRLYRERLPEPGHLIRYEDGRVLLDCLERAAIHYASAVRLKPRDPKLHLMLGRVLEQLHYAAEMHGLSRQQAEGDAQDLDGAQVAGKEDEVLAICKLHGFSSGPTLEEQLKALDAEYRQLREQGLPAKADYIQTLFIWLSKRAGKGGGARAGSLGAERPLQQALLKFLDAWSLSPDDWELNLHAGRLLLLRGQAREALQHLCTGLALRPSHAPLRFYTGLAMLEQDRDPESKVVAALYLQQGLEHFISLSCNPEGLASADKQDTADLLSLRNTQFLQGCLSLGTLLKDCKRPGNAMSPDQVFHATAVLAARGLCGCMCRGEVARQMDWALLYAHYALLQALIQAQVPGREAWVARRCQALNSLIRLATIAPCWELLDLQEKVCQIGVVATPRSSHALCLLGQVQLARYDHEPDSESVRGSLADCLLSFQASIELEDAIQSGPTPRQLAAQKWWQDHQAKKEMEMSANQTASPLGGAHHGSGARAAGEGLSRARMPGRGCAAATPSRRTEKPASPSAKPTPPVARGCTGAKPKCPRTPCKTTSKSKPTPMAPKPACQSSEEQLEPQAPKAGELALDHISSAESMMRNCWSHVPRLGLARALSRSANTMEKACTLYQEVIAMAPEVHDAYIELADLLVKSDPLAAVDVYCKFPLRPISEQNFDDAFITGEIVRILMKEEQFDHPQLGPNLIAYGKVMGLGGLEKYIDILEGKFKTNLLKTVYAGIHDKSVEDKDLQDFFSFKCWI
ncbi:uncharacterized protein LOC125738570 isoform X2 [Brienomyrus brachyistius]|uniref:uncharacterized protein LOC125738570 isoform X2 n=1 Tax=Brienomyrus brachyistius TaxID=42636 RepID=UPI0020B1CE57|nr:uncharacterized protein LOC125738570 isoform X2 [Brienomyrus brachyistius]